MQTKVGRTYSRPTSGTGMPLERRFRCAPIGAHLERCSPNAEISRFDVNSSRSYAKNECGSSEVSSSCGSTGRLRPALCGNQGPFVPRGAARIPQAESGPTHLEMRGPEVRTLNFTERLNRGIEEVRRASPEVRAMNATISQIKAAEGRSRMNLVRAYRRGRMSFSDLQRRTSIVGDGGRWQLINLGSVLEAMGAASANRVHRGGR